MTPGPRVSPAARRLLLAAGVFGPAVLLEVGLDRFVADSSVRQLVMTAAINVMIAASLNVINGMAGQFSIGHAGFVGLGAYAAAIVASHLHLALGGGDPTFAHSLVVVPAAVAAGAAVASLAGVLVGLPSLRLKGDYLAIVTLGFAEMFRLVLTSVPLDAKSGVAGAIAKLGGQIGYSGASGQGVPLYAGPLWVFGAASLIVVATWRIKFSGWGRALRALREDEIAASAVGVDPTRYKVTSFVIAAFGAGVAGALSAIMRDGIGIVQPDQFDFRLSFDAITMVILGGSGSVTGAVVGALFVTFTVKLIELAQGLDAVRLFQSEHAWLDLNALRMVLYASVLIALMIRRPEGLFGEREPLFARKPRGAAPAGAA